MEKKLCIFNAKIYTGFSFVDNGAILVEGDKIIDVMEETRFVKSAIGSDFEKIDAHHRIIAPGFINTHIHGIGGFGVEDDSVESYLKMSEELPKYGVTSFCPTLYPQESNKFISILKKGGEAYGKEKGARIVGMHLEGPFLSSQKLGVQIPEYLKQPSVELMKKFIDISQNHISNMTVAPELKNTRDLALFCLKEGIVLQAGHTNAKYENMLEGFQVGILHSTHLFNAMSPLHHRNPGATGAILLHPEVSCEVINDNHHLHPKLISLLLRLKGPDKIVLVTDALKPTKQKTGELIANGEKVYFEDGIFHRVADGVIAGSSLTMIEGVQKLVTDGVSLELALRMASCNPASVLKLENRGSLISQKMADFTIFDKEFTVMATYVGGKLKYNNNFVKEEK